MPGCVKAAFRVDCCPIIHSRFSPVRRPAKRREIPQTVATDISYPLSIPGAKPEAFSRSAAAVAAVWSVASSPNGPLMTLRWIGYGGLPASSTLHVSLPGRWLIAPISHTPGNQHLRSDINMNQFLVQKCHSCERVNLRFSAPSPISCWQHRGMRI